MPIYQRVYSWQESECEQLWSDILRAGVTDRMGAHFTGSIVYVARGQSTNTSAEPDLIIDGQQRVTTVTLVLAALAQHLHTLPEDEREPWDGFSPKKIRNRYLLNHDEDGERQFKLVLSQGDRDALKAIVLGAEPDDDIPTRVTTNFQFFRNKFSDPTLDLAALCRGLDELVVVDVTLTRGVGNPQLVFEAMNSTGRKLSQADLIRNYVLMDMPPKEFSTEVLALDPGVTRHFFKLYIAFKAETNFADIVPQKALMRLSLNIPIEALHDERGLAWDVSDKGHWGNGPTEVGLAEDDDFTYVMGLVRQAFEYQMGGD